MPIDITAVLFMKTQPPIEPTSFVHSICSDASTASERKRSRWIKRLTPMTLMGKATAKGLEEVAKAVLAPHFHQDSSAIRKVRFPTLPIDSCESETLPHHSHVVICSGQRWGEVDQPCPFHFVITFHDIRIFADRPPRRNSLRFAPLSAITAH